MESSVKLRDEPAQTVVYLHRQGAFGQIPDALGKLMGAITSRGLVPSGPPVGVFFDDPREVAEAHARWEVRWAVGGSPADSEPDADGVGVRTLPPRKLAVTVHTGPYEQVASAYERTARWLAENRYDVVGPPEEAYLSPPETPPEQIRTEVRFPVALAAVAPI